jgi:hypothetical protein
MKTTFFAFFSTFVFCPAALFYGIYLYMRSVERKLQAELQLLANRRGFVFAPGVQRLTVGGSYSAGTLSNVLSGVMPVAGNNFIQYAQQETRGSGKNKRVYTRTVTRVECPDVLSQFIINSRLNDISNTGGNLELYRDSQELKLEGNFSEFFQVLTPDGDERQLLMLLAPDVMEYIVLKFGDYDIELVNSYIYIYDYSKRPPKQREEIIDISDRLVQLLTLRNKDARKVVLSSQTAATNTDSLVARSVDDYKRGRLRKHSFVNILGSLTVFVAVYIGFFLSSSATKTTQILVFGAIAGVGLAAAIIGWMRASKVQQLKRKHNELIMTINTDIAGKK